MAQVRAETTDSLTEEARRLFQPSFYRGTFSADMLPDVQKLQPWGFIANTDPHTRSGKHWVAFMGGDHPNTLHFFDSYGRSPWQVYPLWGKWIERKGFTKLCSSERVVQMEDSNTCGLHCLHYLWHGQTHPHMAEDLPVLSDIGVIKWALGKGINVFD